MSRRLNNTAKLAFYTARKRNGDNTRLAETTDYSVSHVSNVKNGRRSINNTLASAMYDLTRRRMKNSEL